MQRERGWKRVQHHSDNKLASIPLLIYVYSKQKAEVDCREGKALRRESKAERPGSDKCYIVSAGVTQLRR
jgi:hypothetical protein